MSSELTHVQAAQEAQLRSVLLGEGCVIGSGMELAWKLLIGLFIA